MLPFQENYYRQFQSPAVPQLNQTTGLASRPMHQMARDAAERKQRERENQRGKRSLRDSLLGKVMDERLKGAGVDDLEGIWDEINAW